MAEVGGMIHVKKFLVVQKIPLKMQNQHLNLFAIIAHLQWIVIRDVQLQVIVFDIKWLKVKGNNLIKHHNNL